MKKIAKKTQTETKTNKKNIFLLTRDEIEMVHGGKGIVVGATNPGYTLG